MVLRLPAQEPAGARRPGGGTLAMLPKDVLYGMYQEATREKYSFWYVNLRAQKEEMFWVRFDRKFLVNGDDPEPGGGETAGGGPGVR